MIEEFHKAWQEQQQFLGNSDRLSLVDFVRLAKTYLARIMAEQENIRQVYSLFHEQGVVEVEQCSEMILLIRTLYKTLEEFTKFMDQKSSLPLSILPWRYQLLTELICLKEQLWMVLAKVGRFRSLHQSGLGEIALLRYDITCRLRSILESSEFLVNVAHTMLDRARFQEKSNIFVNLQYTAE